MSWHSQSQSALPQQNIWRGTLSAVALRPRTGMTGFITSVSPTCLQADCEGFRRLCVTLTVNGPWTVFIFRPQVRGGKTPTLLGPLLGLTSQLSIFPLSPQDKYRSSFPNVVFSIPDDGQSPKTEQFWRKPVYGSWTAEFYSQEEMQRGF
jgi:hypothetical protein